MGMRVHKVIGYGLKNALVTKAERAAFEAVYESFSELTSPYNRKGKATLYAWILENRPRIDALYGPNAERAWTIEGLHARPGTIDHDKNALTGERLFWEPEFALKRAILIRPLWEAREWFRHDDVIDYIEEHDEDGPVVRFEYLNRGIYPYDKGKPPISVAAVCVFLGIEALYPKLKEAIYVYWC